MNAPNFVYVTYIKTTPQKLWRALTRGNFMLKYWHAKIQSTWKRGAKVQTFSRNDRLDWNGKVLKYDPPKLLSYTFQIMGYQKRSSRVVFEIEKMGATVRLTLSHYGIEPRCRAGIAGGWPVFFSSLKTMLETGKGMKIPG
ncbi:MAG: SRPBCC domain-containing protein [Planctomycetes bacterium]|nr:SRPBCC domain-containing protein [Planctomycetota bacterium]